MVVAVVAVLLASAVSFAAQPATAQDSPSSNETGVAIFTVTNLTVEPASVKVGDRVIIKADVGNNGVSGGVYTAVLRVNGEEADSRELPYLAAGETEGVEFVYTPSSAGSYQCTIDGASGSFEAIAPPEATEPVFDTGPIVYWQPLNDEITQNQEAVFELYMRNPLPNTRALVVDYTAHVPPGSIIYGQQMGASTAAGTVGGTFRVLPGAASAFKMNVKAEKIGTFYAEFNALWWPEGGEPLQPGFYNYPYHVSAPSADYSPASNEVQDYGTVTVRNTTGNTTPIPPIPDKPGWVWVIVAAVGGIGGGILVTKALEKP